jgi:hypothetical protein
VGKIGTVGRGSVATVLAFSCLCVLALPASAGTVLGETFAPTTGCSADSVRLQASSAPPPAAQYSAPTAGVITGWSFQADGAPPQVKLKVGRAAGSDFFIVGESLLQVPVANVPNTYGQMRIPVQAGDVIGTYTATAGNCGREVAGYLRYRVAGDFAPGTTTSNPITTGIPGLQLDVAAFLEPDADGDGFGDETQDCFPSDPTEQDLPLNPGVPCNDAFENARPVSGSTAVLVGDNNGATRQDPPEPDHYECGPGAPGDCGVWVGDHSVWYRWTAAAAGPTAIDTCTAAIDSILAVYTGGSLGSLTRVVDNNNDAACPPNTFGSSVSFDAVAGTEYFIAVGDAGGARENVFVLEINGQPAPPPPDEPGGGGGGGDGADTTSPDTRISAQPKTKTKKKTAVFEFNGSDARAVAGFQCKVDDDAFAPCTSPFTVKVRKGKHNFQVRATDQAGNVDPTPASYDWKVKKKKKK